MAVWWKLLLAAVASVVVSLVLMPRPKRPPPNTVQDLKNPTAEAGRPIPVVFGTITVRGLNLLWYGEKSHHIYKVRM